MLRLTLPLIVATVLISTGLFQTARADAGPRRTARPARFNAANTNPRPIPRQPRARGARPAGSPAGYPYLHAPMYPVPQPRIPVQVGGTYITNQALAPHEMLHEHKYHAVYPPYYYKVSGNWIVTPWGVWSWDDWKLQGTEVKVKYNDHINPLTSLFVPTISRSR